MDDVVVTWTVVPCKEHVGGGEEVVIFISCAAVVEVSGGGGVSYI